jgi:hypothetical protein
MTLNPEILQIRARTLLAEWNLQLQDCLEMASKLTDSVKDDDSLYEYHEALRVRYAYRGADALAAFAVAVLTTVADFKFFYVTAFSVLSFGGVHFVLHNYLITNPLSEDEELLDEACNSLLQTEKKLERTERKLKSLGIKITGSDAGELHEISKGLLVVVLGIIILPYFAVCIGCFCVFIPAFTFWI